MCISNTASLLFHKPTPILSEQAALEHMTQSHRPEFQKMDLNFEQNWRPDAAVETDQKRYVVYNENLRKKKRTALFGTAEVSNYTMLPEHSRWFIRYFTNEGDLVCDNTCGRGTNLIAAAYEGRRIIGYDLNKDNLEGIRDACINRIGRAPEDITLHHSCGVAMKEFKKRRPP